MSPRRVDLGDLGPTRTPARARARRRVLGVLAAAAVATVGWTAALPAAAAPRQSASAKYVALGDSYASGEGLAPYENGTSEPGNQCHRSATLSYPELLNRSDDRAFNRLNSVACSGAGTAALLSDVPDRADERGQLRSLNRGTRTVTLTIGGNDAGFGSVLASCVYSPDPGVQALLPGRPGCAAVNDDEVSDRIEALAGKRYEAGTVPIAVLVALIQARAPRAEIYVTGYPKLFGTSPTTPYGCSVNSALPLFVRADDAAWIRSKATDLNAAIRLGVRQARALGVNAHYVNVAREFAGHNVCDANTPWINPVVLVPAAPPQPPQLSPASFHPTARGQQAFADAVTASD